MLNPPRLNHEGKYPVLRVEFRDESNPGEPLRPTQHEWMGTKPKMWLTVPDDKSSWLLKRARPGTGEHWAEKIACELGLLMGLPIADVHLATWDGQMATLSEGFKSESQALIHGNELLSRIVPNYPKDNQNSYRTKEHTLHAVREALETHNVSVGSLHQSAGLGAFDVFVGYLLLDALICNTDRHHENWAVIADGSGENRTLRLAPTYDHASSLGRELTDEKRSHRLSTNDLRGDVNAYCERAASALHKDEGDKKPLSCADAYITACGMNPLAAEYWKEIIGTLDMITMNAVVTRVPDQLMSPKAKEFSAQMLTNRVRFLQESIK